MELWDQNLEFKKYRTQIYPDNQMNDWKIFVEGVERTPIFGPK